MDRWFEIKGTDILITSIDAVRNKTNLKTISNMQILAYSVVTIPTRLIGKCFTATTCILEVEIDEI